jgi:hypothetical protein
VPKKKKGAGRGKGLSVCASLPRRQATQRRLALYRTPAHWQSGGGARGGEGISLSLLLLILIVIPLSDSCACQLLHMGNLGEGQEAEKVYRQ